MAANYNHYKDQLVKYLYNEKNTITNLLIQAESKTQVKREYLAFGSLFVLIIYLMFGYAAQLLCNLIGFVYPAYCSIKALESNFKDDDTRWLTYWVVFAVFSVCEFFTDILMSWIPFYWLLKCVFLTWCFLPNVWNGSDIIYMKVIRPFFMKHQTNIDAAMTKVTGKLSDLTDTAIRTAAKVD